MRFALPAAALLAAGVLVGCASAQSGAPPPATGSSTASPAGSSTPSTTASVTGTPSPSASLPASPQCVGSVMHIVPHQDDDLLFQSPDLLRDIEAQRCVRVIYVTAGNGDYGDVDYWQSREAGIEASYAFMAGVEDHWTSADAGVAGHPIRLETLVDRPSITVAFMRLPDGSVPGSGDKFEGFQTLQRLYDGAIPSMTAVDKTATYTKAELTATLTQLMTDFKPLTVRTLNFTQKYVQPDHSDHIYTAKFAVDASAAYSGSHTLLGYGTYPVTQLGANVTGRDYEGKLAAYNVYVPYDEDICTENCPRPDLQWLAPQRVLGSIPTGNAAREEGTTVSASSENVRGGQGAAKAVDGFPEGFATDGTREWATAGGKAGSWIQLDFSSPKSLNAVALYDRPNLGDWITSGTLTFSDGGSMPVRTLPNAGSPLVVPFPARSVTWVRFTVDSVGASTTSVGLAEIEALTAFK